MHMHMHMRMRMRYAHMQVSKDLCRLSSELPFDLEECELAMEEDSSGGVDLKKLVKVRAWCIACGVWPDMCMAYAYAWRARGVCVACTRGSCPAPPS